MDKCPPEIHARIFSFACTDDGGAGLSLSLVSKYVREVSTPFQWQSLALPTHHHLLAFATILRQVKDIRHIYHLYISDHGTPPTSSSYWDSQPPDQQSAEVKEALKDILTYASPSLVTLTFFSAVAFMGSGASMTQILSLPYPNLRELTIRGRCTPVQLASVSNSSNAIPAEMPNLRRLHLAIPCHGFAYGNLPEARNLIRALAPNVTHFRLSFLDMWGSKRVAEVIHAELASLGIVSPTLKLPPLEGQEFGMTSVAQEVTWDRLLPESLEQFVIQPSPTMNFYCSCCMDYRGDVDVMRIFEKISERADERRFMYLGRRSQNSMGYGSKEAMYDWMVRKEGGEGCWGRKEDMVFDEEDDRTPRMIPPASSPSPPPGPDRHRGSPSSKFRNLVKKVMLKMW